MFNLDGRNGPLLLSGTPHVNSSSLENLDRLVSQVAALAADHGMDYVAVSLRELRGRSDRSPGRVAFVGQISTGKSHLVNQLLGSKLVEESEVPKVFRVITIKCSGASENTHLPSFEESIGKIDEPQSADVIELEHPWLCNFGLELYDTPGLWGDTDGQADLTAIVRRSALQSDVVVVVVRALGGLNVQERKLLQELAGSSRVSAVMLVISMLDQITGDPDDIMKRARAIAGKISTRIEVFAGLGRPEIVLDSPARLVALRDRLSDLSRRSLQRPVRVIQIARVLVEECDKLAGLASEALAVEAGDESHGEEARRSVKADRYATDARWAAVRLDLEKRRTALSLIQKSLDDLARRLPGIVIR